jgi:hypothetical protein
MFGGGVGAWVGGVGGGVPADVIIVGAAVEKGELGAGDWGGLGLLGSILDMAACETGIGEGEDAMGVGEDDMGVGEDPIGVGELGGAMLDAGGGGLDMGGDGVVVRVGGAGVRGPDG